MLKKNKGVTLSVLVVTIVVIFILAGITISTSDMLIKDTKKKDIIANMYIVKGKAEVIYDDYKFSEEDATHLAGTSVSSSDVASYNATTNADDLWYRWDKATLSNLGLDPEMLQGSGQFIVNYNTGEVIYTLGCEGESGNTIYTLTDMLKD